MGGYIEVQYGAGNVGTSVTQLEYAAPPDLGDHPSRPRQRPSSQ